MGAVEKNKNEKSEIFQPHGCFTFFIYWYTNLLALKQSKCAYCVPVLQQPGHQKRICIFIIPTQSTSSNSTQKTAC